MNARSRSPVIRMVCLTLLLMLLAVPAVAAPGGNGGGGSGGGGNGGGGGGSGGSGGGGGGGQGEDYSHLMLLYRSVDGIPITIGPFEGEHGVEYCLQPISYERLPDPYSLIDGEEPVRLLETTINQVDGRSVTLIPLFAGYQEFLPDEDDDDHGDDHGGGASGGSGGGGGGNGGGGGRGGGRVQVDDTVVPMHQPGDDEEDAGGEFCDPLVIPVGDGIFSYAGYASEVELERLNLARSPEHVLMQHMQEVTALLESTDPASVTLDTSGRPLFDGFHIDAGPKLQGIREALLETGTLPGADARGYPSPFRLMSGFSGDGVVRRDFSSWSNVELSGFALGGAASKFTPISIDAVPYHDRVMGIANDVVANDGWVATLDGPLVEIDGGLQPTPPDVAFERFVSYRGFRYERATTFPGCATYLDPVDEQWVVMPYLEAQYPVDGHWVDVFQPLPPIASDDGVVENIAGYAQMAEDARSMNYFTHLFSELYMPVADPVGVDTCVQQLSALTGG